MFAAAAAARRSSSRSVTGGGGRGGGEGGKRSADAASEEVVAARLEEIAMVIGEVVADNVLKHVSDRVSDAPSTQSSHQRWLVVMKNYRCHEELSTKWFFVATNHQPPYYPAVPITDASVRRERGGGGKVGSGKWEHGNVETLSIMTVSCGEIKSPQSASRKNTMHSSRQTRQASDNSGGG